MSTIGLRNPEGYAAETTLDPGEVFSAMLISNNNSLQSASIEELREAYRAGLSSGPSIQITVDELLARFKADLNVQTKI